MSDPRGYCATCNNTGYVDCYCGGDLCICGQDEIECPDCGGGFADDDDDDECYCDFASRRFFGRHSEEHAPPCPQAVHSSQDDRS